MKDEPCPRCQGYTIEPNRDDLDCRLCGGGGSLSDAVLMRLRKFEIKGMPEDDPLTQFMIDLVKGHPRTVDKAETDQILDQVCERHGFLKPHKKEGAIYWMNEAITSLYRLGYIQAPKRLPLEAVLKESEGE